jgi:hypothetical protein
MALIGKIGIVDVRISRREEQEELLDENENDVANLVELTRSNRALQ